MSPRPSPSSPLNHTRIYGSITSAQVECPSCSRLILFGLSQPHGKAYRRPLAQLNCPHPHCGRSFKIGIILYDAPRGPQIGPPDVRMTRRQLAEARSYVGAFWANVDYQNGKPVNLYMPEECCCLEEPRNCPVHRGRGGPRVPMEEDSPKEE